MSEVRIIIPIGHYGSHNQKGGSNIGFLSIKDLSNASHSIIKNCFDSGDNISLIFYYEKIDSYFYFGGIISIDNRTVPSILSTVSYTIFKFLSKMEYRKLKIESHNNENIEIIKL